MKENLTKDSVDGLDNSVLKCEEFPTQSPCGLRT